MSDQEQQKLSKEQAQLLAIAQQVEGETTPPETHDENGEPIQQPETIESAAAENAAILGAIIDMLEPALPFLPECYDKKTIEKIANAYTAVEEKHGWNARSHLGVEVQLAFVAIPPTIAAVVVGKKYFEWKKEQARLENEAAKLGAGDGRTE
jgi:hypothetical protein